MIDDQRNTFYFGLRLTEPTTRDSREMVEKCTVVALLLTKRNKIGVDISIYQNNFQ